MNRRILSALVLLIAASGAQAQHLRSAGWLQNQVPNDLPTPTAAGPMDNAIPTPPAPEPQAIENALPQSDHYSGNVVTEGADYPGVNFHSYDGQCCNHHGFFHRHVGCASSLGYGCSRPHHTHFARLHCVTHNFKQRCAHFGDRCLNHLRPVLTKPFGCGHGHSHCNLDCGHCGTGYSHCGHGTSHCATAHSHYGHITSHCGLRHGMVHSFKTFRPKLHLPHRWWGTHHTTCCDAGHVGESCCDANDAMATSDDVAPAVPTEAQPAPSVIEDSAGDAGETLLPPAPEPISKETRVQTRGWNLFFQ